MSRSRAAAAPLLLTFFFAIFLGCGDSRPPAGTVTMLIESSPTSLDPRVGTDAQSEHIYALIFDTLTRRDARFGLEPSLATRWEAPNDTTYIFHLRSGVYFHNGQPLTARDVQWTIDSMLKGVVLSVKTSAAYGSIDHIDTPDPLTVVFHLKRPDPTLPMNLADGAIGIIPYGSGRDFWRHPVGSGPFEFVSQQVDKDVTIARNPHYWGGAPSIEQVRFAVVPDATTRALEMRKGSADIVLNALPADMVYALRRDPQLTVEERPGTVLNYLVFNMRDPLLRDLRVRRAIALAINRSLIIQSLWRGEARIAESLLPPEHWAWTDATAHHLYDPSHANALLDAAGYKRGADGIRFHLSMKTSTDETTRLLSMVLQQQLREVGIALDLRSYEFATFYADLTRGAFQMAPSRWIGGNENPETYRYAFASSSFPPHGANRGYYSNPEVDRLIADAATTGDRTRLRADYVQVQQILADELPSINLWYLDNVIVHTRRITNIHLSPSGNFDFLRTAIVSQ